MTYNGRSPKNTSNTGGSVFPDIEGMEPSYTWEYGDPSQSKDPNDVNDSIYHAIFEDIAAYQKKVELHKQ